MELSLSRPPYSIPSYSLTGDLLAYLKCGLQYRYQNRGALPPARPVQLWFGEFIHAVMEEGYLQWFAESHLRRFPWDWATDIRPIEVEIFRRLRARGLWAPRQLFCPAGATASAPCTCTDAARENHRLLASRRTDAAINTWGVHLFPLIAKAEVHLQGLRAMPTSGPRRADYYEVSGTVDVLGSVEIGRAPRGNMVLHYLNQDETIQTAIGQLGGDRYEVIVDYKGTRRPSRTRPEWRHYAWQVLTYAWLRSQQPDASPVVAGVLLFLNELEPSAEDIDLLQEEMAAGATDIMPADRDAQLLNGWQSGRAVPTLSTVLRESRSIRVIPILPALVTDSLGEFDGVVSDIESSVLHEMSGQAVVAAWQARASGLSYSAPERRTCTACDHKYHCPLAPSVNEGGPPSAP
jgi:hypothetical protein